MSRSGPGHVDDRKFGWQLGVALAVVTAISVWRGWWPWLTATLGVLAAVLLIAAAVAPSVLGPVNRAWMGLSHLLSKIVSPIVLFLMFLILITPIAVIMRIRGRDALHLKDARRRSYWIPRESGALEPASFSRQF